MTRLTTHIRDQIVANALAKTTFAAEEGVIEQERFALAEAFRIEALGGAEQARKIEKLAARIEKELAELPAGVVLYGQPIRKSHEMWRMNLGGARVVIPFGDSTEQQRIAPSGSVFAGDHPLVLQFHSLENRGADLDKRRNDLRDSVRAVLNSCTTIKKLLTVWPEAKELLPASLEEARSQLPAVQTAELNAALGLPS